MKNILTFILISILSIGLFGCSGSGTTDNTSNPMGGNGDSGQGNNSGSITEEESAEYQVIFTSLWNAADHVSVPGNAHFSPIVMTVHNDNHRLFTIGEMVSSGFELLAELGGTSGIENEIQGDLDNNHVAIRYTRANQFVPSQASQIFSIEASKNYPRVSFASMIAPSPDWVVGLDGLELYTSDDGFLNDSGEILLFAYDAGTEQGDTPGNFSIGNSPTSPQQTLSRLGAGFEKPFAKIQFIKK